MVELIRRLGFLPQYCVWELTLRCNLRCGHCGSRAGVPRPKELSLEECLRVADDLIALHCHQLSLSGGEPTLFEGWDRLGARLASGGVRVNLISNGWHFTGEHLARARNAGVENLAFSVDGLEADHDVIRGEGSFRRVLAAIDRSVEAGVDVAVNTTLDRVNARRLAALHELLGAHGVSHLQVQLGVPTGNLADRRERALHPVDLLWVIPDLAALRVARRAEGARPSIAVAENLGYYGRHERDLREVGRPIPFWTGCRAGCRVIGIESGGDLKPCLSLPSSLHGEGRFVEGNLRRASLTELWCSPTGFALNRAFEDGMLHGFCAVCRYRDLCRGGCRWTAFAWSGDPYDNPCCFYRQALRAGRRDLLDPDDQPSAAELAYRESERDRQLR